MNKKRERKIWRAVRSRRQIESFKFSLAIPLRQNKFQWWKLQKVQSQRPAHPSSVFFPLIFFFMFPRGREWFYICEPAKWHVMLTHAKKKEPARDDPELKRRQRVERKKSSTLANTCERTRLTVFFPRNPVLFSHDNIFTLQTPLAILFQPFNYSLPKK